MAYDTQVALRSHTFIEIVVNPSLTLTFSDYFKAYTIDSINFTGLGSLMSVTNQASEIRASGKEIIITVSGIPDSSMQSVLSVDYRGSEVNIYRGVFDVTTGELVVTPGVTNPAQAFRGMLTNYGLSEDHDHPTLSSSNTIVFTVASEVGLLNNKTTGRRTNPTDQRRFYPTDPSMDRVPNLMRSQFNFGAPS